MEGQKGVGGGDLKRQVHWLQMEPVSCKPSFGPLRDLELSWVLYTHSIRGGVGWAGVTVRKEGSVYICPTCTLDSGKLIFSATSSRMKMSGYRVLANSASSTSSCARVNVVLSRRCFRGVAAGQEAQGPLGWGAVSQSQGSRWVSDSPHPHTSALPGSSAPARPGRYPRSPHPSPSSAPPANTAPSRGDRTAPDVGDRSSQSVPSKANKTNEIKNKKQEPSKINP